MTSSLRTTCALAVAVPVLALSACGGSDDTLSKSKIAAKADAICKTTNAKLKTLAQPQNIQQAAVYYAALAKELDAQEADFKNLKPADDVKAQWNAFLALVAQNGTLVHQLVTAAKTTDNAKGKATATQIQALTPKLNAAADAIGATGCGSGSA